MKNFNTLMILISSLIIYADFLPRKILADTDPSPISATCLAIINVAMAADRIEQTCKQYHRGYMNDIATKTSLNETLSLEMYKKRPDLKDIAKAKAIEAYYSCSNIMPK